MGLLWIIALIIQVAFGLILLVAFFLHLAETSRYLKVGVLMALVAFVLTVLRIFPPSLFLLRHICVLPVLLVLYFLRTMVNTSVGMYYCASLQVPSFALWERIARSSFPALSPAGFPPPPESGAEVHPAPSGEALPERPSEPSPEPWPAPGFPPEGPTEKIRWQPFLLTTFAVIAGGVIFSVILFRLTTPRLAGPFRGLEPIPSSPGPLYINILAALEAAFTEEIAFRMCIQNYLARVLRLPRRAYGLAIVLSAAFWALAHGEVLDPAWVKPVQVFPIGLGLGYLARRWGLESSILAHAGFNLILIVLSPWLLGA